MQNRAFVAPKVPQVIALFWVIKLLTTAIGETGADFMGTISIPLAGVVGVGGFFVAIALQLRESTYQPLRYWLTVLTVALFGTMIADGPHVALGTPYWFDSIVYFVLLCGLFGWWYRSEGTLSVHSIVTSRRERFYWGTVLLTFGLGTALGDAAAINAGLGFFWSIVIFGIGIVLPLAAWRFGASSVVCFWSSYVLTRPLGASVADYLASRPEKGGLGWGTGPVTGVGLLLFAGLVAYVCLTHADVDPVADQAELDAARESADELWRRGPGTRHRPPDVSLRGG